MNNRFKNRFKIKDLRIKLSVTLAFILAVAVMYIGEIGCVFKNVFGIVCPGCGLTRAFVSLFKLDFASAFEYHSLFFTVPVLYLYFLLDGHVWNKMADACILCGIFIGFFVRWIIVLV